MKCQPAGQRGDVTLLFCASAGAPVHAASRAHNTHGTRHAPWRGRDVRDPSSVTGELKSDMYNDVQTKSRCRFSVNQPQAVARLGYDRATCSAVVHWTTLGQQNTVGSVGLTGLS